MRRGLLLESQNENIVLKSVRLPEAMARAHQAYKVKHDINGNPEVLTSTPAAEQFLLPELYSGCAAGASSIMSHHGRRRPSQLGPAQARPASGQTQPPARVESERPGLKSPRSGSKPRQSTCVRPRRRPRSAGRPPGVRIEKLGWRKASSMRHVLSAKATQSDGLIE